ncbi:hypothetical protein [Pseudoalteromonas sp. ASV78]|uniref:hypothetical protein n=1 Tax=Pseudoalteromonas sp. ASV78 TaxID=3397851 RepID=UPI0039FD796B
MTRTIDYNGEKLEISDYKPENYFDNQKEWVTEHIPLNPNLRDDFDFTPNKERDGLEIEHWWGKPYIVAEFATLSYRNYSTYREELESRGSTDIVSEKEFHEKYSDLSMEDPSCIHGVTFVVRCLDGGAWDRSTWKGQFNNLTDAISWANIIVIK